MSSPMDKKDTFQEHRKPSPRQELGVVNFIQKHPLLIQSKQSRILNRVKVYKLWIEMAKEMNSIEGVEKSPTGWLRYWIDKRKHVSVKHRQIKSGVPNLKLSPLEKKILKLCINEKKVAAASGATTADGSSRSGATTSRAEAGHSARAGAAAGAADRSTISEAASETSGIDASAGTRDRGARTERAARAPTAPRGETRIEIEKHNKQINHELTADHPEVTQHKEDDNVENHEEIYIIECNGTNQNDSFKSDENNMKMIEVMQINHELTADHPEVTQHKEDDNVENHEEIYSIECNGTNQNDSFKSDENNMKMIEVMVDAVNRLTDSIESIGAALSDMKNAVASITDVLKSSLQPDQNSEEQVYYIISDEAI